PSPPPSPPRPAAPAPGAPTSAASAAPAPRREVTLGLIAGIRFRPGGRVIGCLTGGLALEVGTRVVVNLERGTELGIVTLAPTERPSRARMPRIVRVADERERERARGEQQRGWDALQVARETAAELKLPVK